MVQPADRFWHFQLLKAGVYALLAIGCLITAVAVLRRRPR
jgi:hypothetical protein